MHVVASFEGQHTDFPFFCAPRQFTCRTEVQARVARPKPNQVFDRICEAHPPIRTAPDLRGAGSDELRTALAKHWLGEPTRFLIGIAHKLGLGRILRKQQR